MFLVTWWPMLLILTLALVLQLTAGMVIEEYQDRHAISTDSNIRPNEHIALGKKDNKCIGIIHKKRGICETSQDCLHKGGRIDGDCGHAEKHCCIFVTDCMLYGPKVLFNDTYIIDTHPSSRHYSHCHVAIQVPKNIKQIRLEFIKFRLAEPNKTTGICERDNLFISGGTTDMRICGNFTGQHLYFDVNGDIMLKCIYGPAYFDRTWEINIIYLYSTQQAPTGCLQYFQQSLGRFTTLNYMLNGILMTSLDHYTVCIRIEKDTCSLEFGRCNQDEANNFKAIETFHERNIPEETFQYLVQFRPGGEKDISELNSAKCISFLQRKSCNL